jgi:hypothetical protein
MDLIDPNEFAIEEWLIREGIPLPIVEHLTLKTQGKKQKQEDHKTFHGTKNAKTMPQLKRFKKCYEKGVFEKGPGTSVRSAKSGSLGLTAQE